MWAPFWEAETNVTPLRRKFQAGRGEAPAKRLRKRRSGRKAAHPDARGGRLAEMHFAAGDAKSHGFVVLAALHAHFCGRLEFQSIEEFQKLRIFFKHAEDFGAFPSAQVGKLHGALLFQRGEPSTQRHSVRASTLGAKTFEEKLLTSGEIPCSSRSASSC